MESLKERHVGSLLSAVVASSILAGGATLHGQVETAASFPMSGAQALGLAGRFEISIKLSGYSANGIINTGGDPNLIGGTLGGVFGTGILGMSFNANNGGGESGITAIIANLNGVASTGSLDSTIGGVLGNQASVNDWHTYDAVWNQGGLSTGDAANGHQLAVYVDGVLRSQSYVDTLGTFTATRYTFDIGYTGTSTPSQSATFDNLRVWDGTDKATSTLVLANDFENQSLISSVGPNGDYITGTFVPGLVGNGLSTVGSLPPPPPVMPEPGSIGLLAGLALLGFGGWNRSRESMGSHRFAN